VRRLLSLLLAFQIHTYPTELVRHPGGFVTPYAPGMMEEVLERRLKYYRDLHPLWVPSCLAALNDNHLDTYIIVIWPAGWRICYVVDLAQPEHSLIRSNQCLELEVDSKTYADLGRGPVIIFLMQGRNK